MGIRGQKDNSSKSYSLGGGGGELDLVCRVNDPLKLL